MLKQREKQNESSTANGRLDPSVLSCVDIHCHCLPGLDDGPSDLTTALDLCREMVADGINIAIATPHQLGSYERVNSADEIRGSTEKLNQKLGELNIPLKLVPGAEVRIDGRLMDLLESDVILTLADQGRHLLLELPSEPLMDLRPVIVLLNSRQITAIIPHPERQRALRRRFDVLRLWSEMGVAFQINAASLVGQGAPGDREMAWSMIEQGLVDLVASDCHDSKHRKPLLSAARQLLLDRVGYTLTRRICFENPLAVLGGESISTRLRIPSAVGRGS